VLTLVQALRGGAALRLPALSASVRAQLPEWALAVLPATGLGAVAPPVRDITKTLPTLPSSETARSAVLGGDLMARRAALLAAGGVARGSVLSVITLSRAAELHRLLAETWPEYAAARGLPDLPGLLSARAANNELCLQWLVPGSSPDATLLVYCRAGELIAGARRVSVAEAVAVRRRVQDLQANSAEVRNVCDVCMYSRLSACNSGMAMVHTRFSLAHRPLRAKFVAARPPSAAFLALVASMPPA
jgi:hypothetical protein